MAMATSVYAWTGVSVPSSAFMVTQVQYTALDADNMQQPNATSAPLMAPVLPPVMSSSMDSLYSLPQSALAQTAFQALAPSPMQQLVSAIPCSHACS